jgi:prepilin-type N-terminal cleavage/methylation domain-containing protein
MKARQTGFTLLEVMIVIALLAVLVGIGAPSFGDFLRNSRITGKANDLLAGLSLARTEAIKRHAPVSVCATDDASAATPTCDAAADFSQWIAFVDDDGDPDAVSGDEGNGTFEPGSDEILLTRSSGTIASITTTPSAAVADGDDIRYVQFGLDGFQRRGDGSAPTDLSVLMCDDRGNKAISGADTSAARALFISRTGRAEVSRSVTRITAAGGCP